MKHNKVGHAERGAAISLSEMMIAVVVSAILIGGVIVALLSIVPWMQDEAAKRNLGEIAKAQEIYQVENAAFVDSNNGVEYGELQQDGDTLTRHIKASPTEYCSTPDTNGNYVSYAVSGSGKIFTATNTQKTPVEATLEDALAACPDLFVNGGTLPPVAFDPTDPWNIEDPNLMAAVKTALSVDPADPLTLAHATQLNNSHGAAMLAEVVTAANSWNVTTFAGLEQATNYTTMPGIVLVSTCDLGGFRGTSDTRGLNNITTVGGITVIPGGDSFTCSGSLPSSLPLPALSTIQGDLMLQGTLYTAAPSETITVLTPSLRTVGSYLNIQGTQWVMSSSSFSALESAGRLTLLNLRDSSVVRFPNLSGTLTSMSLNHAGGNFQNAFPLLEGVSGLMEIIGANNTVNFQNAFPSLLTAYEARLANLNPTARNITFPALTSTTIVSATTIQGNMTDVFPALLTTNQLAIGLTTSGAIFDDFNSLTEITGTMLSTTLPANTTFRGFDSLTQTNTAITIRGTGTGAGTTIDSFPLFERSTGVCGSCTSINLNDLQDATLTNGTLANLTGNINWAGVATNLTAFRNHMGYE